MTVPNDFQAKGIFNIFVRKVNGYIRKVVKASSGGNTIFISALVTIKGETAASPEVDLAAKGEPISGVITGQAWAARDMSKDSDSPFTDGTYLLMERLDPGDQVWLTAKTNTAITFGGTVQCDGGYIIDFAYSDSAAATDLLGGTIGEALVGCSQTASQEKLCLIEVSAMGGGV